MNAAAHRISFRFSARGDDAAFLYTAATGGLGVGTWSWQGGAPAHRVLTGGGESVYSQPLPLGDGRVLVLRSGAGSHELFLITAARIESVGRIESRGLRLLGSPAAGIMAVAIGLTDDGNPALWLLHEVREASPRIQALPTPPIPAGQLHGGHWADDSGVTLCLEHHEGSQTRIMALDLSHGTVTWPGSSAKGSHDDRLLLSQRRSGSFLVARKTAGDVRLGVGKWDRGDWSLTFPAAIGSFRGSLSPLAIDPTGNHVALCVEEGLRSKLCLLEPGTGARRTIAVDGGLLPTASWTPSGLHLVASSPVQPTQITTIPAVASGLPGALDLPPVLRPALRPVYPPVAQRGQEPPATELGACAGVLAGPAGPIEAVIYGGPQWRAARRLLFALHGGPHAAWKLSFDPLLADLAAAGVAIVAPNQRGSAGYGEPHRSAIHQAWGGPDLEDIRHLAGQVSVYRRERGLAPLMLYGVSYGAFLALLAAAASPGLWSHCVAVAPFSSAQSLYEEGSEGVRSFLRRHCALGPVRDELGSRDLCRLADRITARLLIIHGSEDETIPVGQSRHIIAALERAGRRPGDDLIYREIPGAHDPLKGAAGQATRRLIQEFLAQEACRDVQVVPT